MRYPHSLIVKVLTGISPIIFSTVVFASPVEDAPMQWYSSLYASAKFGYGTTDVSRGDIKSRLAKEGLTADVLSLDTGRMAWNIGVGYDFNKQWSAELSYYDLGGVEMVYQLTPATQNTGNVFPESGSGISLAGKYRHNLSDTIDLTAQLGLFSWKGEYETVSTTGASAAADDESSTDLHYGVGLDYKIGRQWRMTSLVQRFHLSSDNTLLLTVGVEYRH